MASYRYTVTYRPDGMKPIWNENLSWETDTQLMTTGELLQEANDRIDQKLHYITFSWTIVSVCEETITLTRTLTPEKV